MKTKIILHFYNYYIGSSIKWNSKERPNYMESNKVEHIIGLGDTNHLTVTFTCDKDMNNVELWVVPELQSFLNLDPMSFNIKKGQNYTVNVTINIPYGTTSGMYNGTIHAKVGSRTYLQTLKVKINVVDLMEGAIPPPDTIPEITTIQYKQKMVIYLIWR